MAKLNEESASRAPRLEMALVVVLLAVAALVALGRANPLVGRVGTDSGNYTYIATHLLRGGTPYVSAWTSKPPGIFFIDAAGLWLGGGSRWGIWGIEFAFLFASALLGYVTLRREYGLGPAVIGSLAWLSAMGPLLGAGNRTEEYSLLFSFAALWLLARILGRPESLWPLVALGVTLGCGFLMRPNNIGAQAAVLASLAVTVWPRRPFSHALKAVGAAAAGIFLPLATVSLYFAARGAFQPFLEGSVLYNISYVMYGEYGGEGLQLDALASLRGGFVELGWAGFAGAAGALLAFVSLIREIARRSPQPWTVWLCTAFAVEVVLSGLSGRNYAHYFICWLPWIAVACARLFRAMLVALPAQLEGFRAWSLVAAIIVLSAASWRALAGYHPGLSPRFSTAGLRRQQAQVAYILANTKPGDTVLSWGNGAGLNFLSGRDAPSPYFTYGWLVPSDRTDSMSERFLRDLRSRPPALVFDTEWPDYPPPLSAADPVAWSQAHNTYPQPHISEVFDFFHRNYAYGGEVGGLAVYTLNR